MSAIPSGAVFFDIKAQADGAKKVLAETQSGLRQVAAEAKRTKIEIPATIDTRQLQKDAEFSKEVIRGVQREADKLLKARQQAFAAARKNAGGGGGGDDDPMRGFSVLGTFGPIAGIRALESGFTGLTEAIINGTNRWEGFTRGLVSGIPIIGHVTAELGDAIVKLNEIRLLRARGLNTAEENETFGRFIDPDVRRRDQIQSALDRADEEQRRHAELGGLSGFDLQRARARQQADERAAAVGAFGNDRLDALPKEEREKIQERIADLQKRIADDLEKDLRKINAEEGIKEIGGAVKDWFKGLEEKVKNEAKAARLAERNQQEFLEEVGGTEKKENELRLKRNREEDKARRRGMIESLEEQIDAMRNNVTFTGAGVQTNAATVDFGRGADREQERKLQAMIDLLKQIRDKDPAALTS